MAQYKYMGPSDTFTVGNKTYRKGDTLNVSAEFVKHHKVHGHVFAQGDELIGNAVENPTTVTNVETKATAKAEDK